MIRTRDLTMHYGGLKALQGLNLDIEPGEFFAFLGANAAGKTTTIKLITGLLRPTAGDAGPPSVGFRARCGGLLR